MCHRNRCHRCLTLIRIHVSHWCVAVAAAEDSDWNTEPTILRWPFAEALDAADTAWRPNRMDSLAATDRDLVVVLCMVMLNLSYLTMMLTMVTVDFVTEISGTNSMLAQKDCGQRRISFVRRCCSISWTPFASPPAENWFWTNSNDGQTLSHLSTCQLGCIWLGDTICMLFAYSCWWHIYYSSCIPVCFAICCRPVRKMTAKEREQKNKKIGSVFNNWMNKNNRGK